MTTNNHPANGPVSLERLHQIRETLSKSAAQSDGGNLGYAMADAVKVIDVAIAAFGAKLDENGILPCPLCGGGAEFDYDDDNLNWISCSACGISTDTVYHTNIDARDKLREVWNRRAAMLQAGNHTEKHLDMVDHSGDANKMVDGKSPVIQDDVRRMDWLVSKTVDVREPMVYGSHSIFCSQTITDEDDDYHATKLREQIDAAMAAEQEAAPQQDDL